MSRRSLKKRNTLGIAPSKSAKHLDHGRQCLGEKGKFNSTRPHSVVKGTGKWLNKGTGVGHTVTLPEN